MHLPTCGLGEAGVTPLLLLLPRRLRRPQFVLLRPHLFWGVGLGGLWGVDELVRVCDVGTFPTPIHIYISVHNYI